MSPFQDVEKKHQRPTELFDQFTRDFSFRLARDEEERLRVYHLRHRVYCQEIGYSPPEIERADIEKDHHDQHAFHCLVEHNRSGMSAGCFRMVVPASVETPGEHSLPFQDYAGNSLVDERFQPKNLPKATTCEISRFATARTFRHHPINHETINEKELEYLFTPDEKKVFPILTTALFLATHALVDIAGRRHIFAMMDPRLPRLLRMSGFHFTKVGNTIDMYGKRNAYYIDNDIAERDMHDSLRPLYHHVRRELKAQRDSALPHAWESGHHFFMSLSSVTSS